jgi:hypothetical protein
MESVSDAKGLQSPTSKTRMLNKITNILKSKGPIVNRLLWKKKNTTTTKQPVSYLQLEDMKDSDLRDCNLHAIYIQAEHDNP